MEFEKQKPVSDEYRERWERTFSIDNRIGYGPEQDIRLVNVEVPAYPNGCPILNEDQ